MATATTMRGSDRPVTSAAATASERMRAEAKRLRVEAATISENIATMEGTQVHIGETRGWSDPMIERIERDVQAALLTRTGLIGEARGLCRAAAMLAA